jgi:hypothetical protein
MKKIFALIVGMLSVNVAFADMIAPKISYDLGSQQNYKTEGFFSDRTYNYDTDPGITIGVDYIHPVNDQFSFGGGFEYQTVRKMDLAQGFDVVPKLYPQFNFLPLYITGILSPFRSGIGSIKPYGKLNLGYDFLMGNDDFKARGELKGGVYWGIGAGASYKNFIVELFYSICTGKIEGHYPNREVKYEKLAFNIGYQFDLNALRK